MKTVTFCGHGNLSGSEISFLEEKLLSEIKNLITNGADTFLLGGYGDFDILCAQIIKNLKQNYPHITSVLVIPYIDKKYNNQLYDCSEYPPIENVPKRFAISKRNEYMVDHSQIVVAYITHNWGGAYKTLNYAKRKDKIIINI